MLARSPLFYVCIAAWRIVLPIILLAASVLRVSCISLVYFCLLLVLPTVSTPKTAAYSTSALSRLNVTVILSSFIAVLAQAAFQLFLVIDAQKQSVDYGHGLSNCSLNETILRHVGLQRLDFGDPPNAARLVLPDVLLLLVGIAIHVLSRCTAPRWRSAGLPAGIHSHHTVGRSSKVMARLLADAADLSTFALVGLCAVLVPSATSAPYMIVFLGTGVWWSALGNFSKRCLFAVKATLATYMALHMVLLYVCQAQWIAARLAVDADYYVRLFGVAALVESNCSTPWAVNVVPHGWTYFANPVALLVAYFALVTQIRHQVEQSTALASHSEAEGTDEPDDVPERRRRGRSRSLERQNLVEDSYTPYNTFAGAAGRAGRDDSDAHVSHSYEPPSVHVRVPNSSRGGGAQPLPLPTGGDSADSAADDRHWGGGGSSRATLLALLLYVKESSYLLMFVSLMAWSVVYRSWMALPLLVLACVVWLIPDSRLAALHASPLVSLYAIVLIVIEYVSAINSADDSAGVHSGAPLFFNYSKTLNDTGIQAESTPGVSVLIKVIFTTVYWLTMRQFFTERRVVRHAIDGIGDRRESVGSSARSSAHIREFGSRVTRMFGGLWIFFFSILFLVMSVQEAYIYKMIYMVFFLFYVMTFQISFATWKAMLRIFLWLVALYSIVVVVTVYTLSFSNVLVKLINVSGVNITLIKDLGFDIQDGDGTNASVLLNRLIVPAVFLIAIMLQLHVFHDAFLHSISTDVGRSWADSSATAIGLSPDSPVRRPRQNTTVTEYSVGSGRQEGCCAAFTGFVARSLKKLWPALVEFFNFCLMVVECHMTKAVALIVTYVSLNEPSAVNFVLLLIVCTLMHTAKSAKIMVLACQLWVGLIILVKMAYKLRTVPGDLFERNCTLNTTVDSASWLGLDKDGVLPGYISGEVGIIVAVCIYAVVKTRQDLHFSAFGSERPPAGQVFQDISVEAAENSAVKLIQFIFNYGFQTLGLEISFATSMIVIVSRQDGMALLYACLLAMMLLLAAHSRRSCARMWPFYLVFLVILLPAQYLAVVGLPPTLCTSYPWNISDPALRKWLYLPGDSGPYSRPDAGLLLGDFFQLLMVSLQMQVFSRELLRTRHSVTYPPTEAETGSCNAVAVGEGEPHDFIDSIRNVVDVLKNIVFVYWFLGTLIIMFVTGTVNINLFCFGYVAASFYFMWFGDDFLQKKKAVRLRSWHLAMVYNFAVILVKLVMQLVGCALPDRIPPLDCVVVQLLSITCLSPLAGSAVAVDSCTVPQSAASFTWDVVCFIALLIQRKIFLSRYFILTVIEIKTENKLASSGARLINQLLASRRKKRKEEEEKNLETLQRKVERIQLRQLRLQQSSAVEFDEHYKVIRSGGAYMFEGDSDDDELTSTTDGNTLNADDPADAGDYLNVGVDPLSLVTIAVNQGVKSSLATAARAQQQQQQQHRGETTDVPTGAADACQSLLTEEATTGTAGGQPSAPMAESPVDQMSAVATGPADEGLNDLNTVNVTVKDASWETTKDVARLSKTLCESMVDYITIKLLSISKDYRIIARQLQQERKKVKLDIKKSLARPPGQASLAAISQPLVDLEASFGDGRAVLSESRSPHDSADSEPPTDPASPTRLEQEITAEDGMLEESIRVSPTDDANGTGDHNLAHSSRIYRLISVFCVAILSRTEFLCYFAMILSHLCSGSVLTMPLPMAAFLWGQLSIPRPAKTFWVFMLTYVMVTMLIKYVCQFSFNKWNDNPTMDVFQPASIIGLMKGSDYAVFDILVLVCLFLHRSALRKYGLWKSASEMKFDLARAKSTVRSWQPNGRDGSGAVDAATTTVTTEQPPGLSPSLEETVDSGSGRPDAGTVAPPEAVTKELPEGKETAEHPAAGIKERLSAWANGLVGRDHNASFDVYPYIFFCDFVNFVIVVFFYWSFGPTAGNVTSYLRDNRIPWPFLIQLLLQFVLIVVDRALYLRRNAFGKFVFQVVLVIVVHLWMFFLLPWITQLPFISNKPAQIWYFIKCIYFWLSAYQIRAGYPINTIAGSFFRKHNYLSWTLLGLARAVPFLMEMRIAMDWIWTESSLALGHWFTMEDVYVNVFSMKCLRDMELKYPTPRGHNRGAASKYAWGGFVLFGLAFIVWFPLLLFSFANAVYTPNAPVECTFTLTVGSYQPLFTAIAQGDSVASVTRTDYYTQLKESFKNTKDASSFLENYDERDVRVITFRGDSTAVWAISPPDKESLLADVCGNVSLSMTVHITLTRTSAENLVARIIKGEFSQSLTPMSPVRMQLCDLIRSSNASSNTVVIPKLFPRFITVPATGTPSASPLNLPSGLLPYSNVTLTLNNTLASPSCPCDNSWWWKVQENTTYPHVLNATDYESPVVQDLSIVTFSNRVAPIGFSFLTGYGVIGLYVSIVFVIGRFLRIFTSGHLKTIMFDELPNVDKILKLCHSIYFARQLKRFRLEEDLFAKLIFLYRSPDLLMRWTKVKVA